MVTYGIYLLDMLVLAEVVGEDDEEVPFAVNELRHKANHIDVCVLAVGLETVATKHLQTVAQLFEVKVGVFGVDSDVIHPLVDNLRHFSDYTLLDELCFMTVIVVLVQDLIEDSQVLLIVFRITLGTDDLMRVLEFLKVLIGRKTVRL